MQRHEPPSREPRMLMAWATHYRGVRLRTYGAGPHVDIPAACPPRTLNGRGRCYYLIIRTDRLAVIHHRRGWARALAPSVIRSGPLRLEPQGLEFTLNP